MAIMPAVSDGATSDIPRDGSAPPSAGLRWYVLIITMLIYTFSIADRYVISTVLEPIRLEFHLTEGQAAGYTGVALGLFYVIMGLPMSWVADRHNRRNLLVFSVAAWSVMTTLCGFVRGPFQLGLARIGVGVGEAGGTPPSNSIIADYFPPTKRAMATTIFALGAPIGAWLGSDLAGWVAEKYNWRAAFYVLGLPGIVLALIILFTLKEPPRGRYDAPNTQASPTFLATLRFLRTQKGGMHTMMATGLSALWGWGLMWFTPTFIERTYHLGSGAGGQILSPYHLFGGVGASLLTAWLMTRPGFKYPRWILRLLGVVTALATIPSFLVFYTHSMVMMKFMLWLFVPAIYFYLGPAFAMVQNFAPPKMRAMYIAISLLVANVFNLIIAPQCISWLSDWFSHGHPDAASLRLALLIWAPTGFWTALHYWLAERHALEDMERAIGLETLVNTRIEPVKA